VLRINICGENRHLRQARNRYSQLLIIKTKNMRQKESTKEQWLSNIINSWTWEFNQIPETLLNDVDIWKEIVKSRPSLYSYIPDILKNNRDIALNAVQFDGMILQLVNSEFKNDFEMVSHAVLNNAKALEYASERIRDNEELISKIDFTNKAFGGYKQGNYLRFASRKILRNRDILIRAIQNDEWGRITHYNNSKPLISYLDLDLQLEFELAKLSVINNIESFDFLHQSMQENNEIIEIVIDKLGNDIRDLTNGMRNSKYIIDKFFTQNPDNFEYASDELKNNADIIAKYVSLDGLCLKYASERIRDLKEIVLAAVKNNGLAVRFSSENLKKDFDIGINAVSENGDALEYLSEDLKDNLEVVSLAISTKMRFRKTSSWGFNSANELIEVKDGLAIRFASDRLKSNKELVLNAIRNSNEIELDSFGFSQTKRYNEIPLAKYLPNFILEDKEIALQLIRNNPNSRKHFNPINILSEKDYKLIEHNLDKNNQPNINVINKIQKIKTNYPNHNLLKKLEAGEILYLNEINYTPFANIQLSDFMTYYFGQIISK
jgi:hypothetical protein